jgi:hypothetical protein
MSNILWRIKALNVEELKELLLNYFKKNKIPKKEYDVIFSIPKIELYNIAKNLPINYLDDYLNKSTLLIPTTDVLISKNEDNRAKPINNKTVPSHIDKTNNKKLMKNSQNKRRTEPQPIEKVKPLIVVDIQPAYIKNIQNKLKLTEFMDYLNKYEGKILLLVNEKGNGTEDTIDEIREFYVEWGLKKRALAHIKIFDKGHGYLRDWMDKYIDRETIIKVLKHMISVDIEDIRDLEEQYPGKLQELLEEDNYDIEDVKDLHLTGGWIELSILKQFNDCYICGGGRWECLEEVLIYMDALNIKYTLLKNYIYS